LSPAPDVKVSRERGKRHSSTSLTTT